MRRVLLGIAGGCAAAVVLVLAQIVVWGLNADFDDDPYADYDTDCADDADADD